MRLKYGDKVFVRSTQYPYCSSLTLKRPSEEYFFYRYGDPGWPTSKKVVQVYPRIRSGCGHDHPETRVAALIIWDDPALHNEYLEAWDSLVTYNDLYLATRDQGLSELFIDTNQKIYELEQLIRAKRS